VIFSAALIKKINKIKEQKYKTNKSEYMKGICCVGVMYSGE
jgi:DNA-binding IclR family transcriptional regulator